MIETYNKAIAAASVAKSFGWWRSAIKPAEKYAPDIPSAIFGYPVPTI